jgi:hypothetical protein
VRSVKAGSGPKRGKARGARRVDRLGQQIGAEANPRKPELQAVYDGRTRIGFIVNRGRAGFEAFDAGERSLGVFPDLRRAADAVSAAGVAS